MATTGLLAVAGLVGLVEMVQRIPRRRRYAVFVREALSCRPARDGADAWPARPHARHRDLLQHGIELRRVFTLRQPEWATYELVRGSE
ncbi:hypothetical protein ADK34_39340 [Streptomyces viridochromogenes]|uniref:Uncharacterized protein n=1 Tax=Streptomyces viridochromogenes TaxID=1938 RepID=A0A0L8J3K9_STRVR|nr:hypothetical protein ADK34_39340 [Streptomyces viridochromogenes]